MFAIMTLIENSTPRYVNEACSPEEAAALIGDYYFRHVSTKDVLTYSDGKAVERACERVQRKGPGAIERMSIGQTSFWIQRT